MRRFPTGCRGRFRWSNNSRIDRLDREVTGTRPAPDFENRTDPSIIDIRRRTIMFKNLIMALVLALSLSGTVLAAENAPVDVNTATAEQLAEALVGVGESKAEAIVAYREENGPFRHIDELINVRGIGMATVDNNRDRIRLGMADDGNG
jgi:competence protein ComEA